MISSKGVAAYKKAHIQRVSSSEVKIIPSKTLQTPSRAG